MIAVATTAIGMAIATAIPFSVFSVMVTGTIMKDKRRTCEIKQSVWSSVDEKLLSVNHYYCLQCDAPYRGHPTNIFTSKKLANQGTRF